MRILLTFFLVATACSVKAQLELPSFISEGMVLQQKKANRIWGWAKPHDKVTVEFMSKKYGAFANDLGEWKVFLDPAEASTEANSMIISTSNEKKELKDILIGEVWVCGGQSNMEWRMSWLGNTYKREMETAKNDNIRFVLAKRTIDNMERANIALDRKWSHIDPSTIGDCSAVGYWFAKQLNAKMNVPVGLVLTNWGGTPAQSWISFEGLHDFPGYSNMYEQKIKPIQIKDLERLKKEAKDNFEKGVRERKPLVKEWSQTDFNDASWSEMWLPKKWEEQGFPTLDGIVVYRIAFNVAAEDAGKEAELNLPAVDDMDSSYINGKFIGATNSWIALRKYKIPAGVLKSGKNILTVEVQDNQGGGGFDANEKYFNVVVGGKTIPLAGKSKYIIEAEIKDVTGGGGALEYQPVVLYNGMIAPFLPLSIRGVIWYQGESNAGAAYEYRSLFPAMINDWRNHWGQGDFPFLFVQLSSYGTVKTQPDESNWAELREAQTMTLSLPNTAMAVTVDVGDPGDIHPKQKKEVGERLAASAMKLVYGNKNIVADGPTFKNYKVEGNKIRIGFTNTGSGLMMKGAALKQFSIAGEDKKFVWATAVIKGNEVIVSNPSVSKPVAVRYAWADSPIDANLYNKEGFPAVPFRTDKWKITTQW